MNWQAAQHEDELKRQERLIADLLEFHNLGAKPEALDNMAREIGILDLWNKWKPYKTRKVG